MRMPENHVSATETESVAELMATERELQDKERVFYLYHEETSVCVCAVLVFSEFLLPYLHVSARTIKGLPVQDKEKVL